jgi:hypothetical protein
VRDVGGQGSGGYREECHASTVVEILAMQAPAIMTEAPLNVA